jgi:RecB family exonuclease
MAVESELPTDSLWHELWVSFASLLRSYTAAHGLNKSRQATVELSENRILVRHGDDWLDFERSGATVKWKRTNGTNGTLEFTVAGQLRSAAGEEEMDMAAEAWARELML